MISHKISCISVSAQNRTDHMLYYEGDFFILKIVHTKIQVKKMKTTVLHAVYVERGYI